MRPWLLLLLLLPLSACGQGSAGPPSQRLQLVATTTVAADIARNVGGSRIEVAAILRAGVDPHEYEPRPSDVRKLADADLVVRSGGDLDGWLTGLLENAGGKARVLTLIDSTDPLRSEGREGRDPHWWQDPRNGARAAEAVRDELTRVDPRGRGAYQRNMRRYAARLRALDREISICMQRVPRAQRKLVTTHDALGYFARRYDVEVVGALIPSLSTRAQPSARDVRDLVEQIREEGVKAIFPESALNPKLERAVAREASARVGKALWADSLGPEGSSGETYTGSLAANTAAMVEGMTGGAQSCRPRA